MWWKNVIKRINMIDFTSKAHWTLAVAAACLGFLFFIDLLRTRASGPLEFISTMETPLKGKEKMIWVAAIDGSEPGLCYWKVALHTAQENSPSLHPVLLYYEIEDIETILQPPELYAGVTMIRRAFKFKLPGKRAAAVYARLESASVIMSAFRARLFGAVQETLIDTHFLYTDTDVQFLKDVVPQSLPAPQRVKYGGETVLQSSVPVNTGVMIVNVSWLAREETSIFYFAKANNFDFPSYDQGLFNSYLSGTNQTDRPLDDTFNWKAYWPPSRHIKILHWHGPKPLGDCSACVLLTTKQLQTTNVKHLNLTGSCPLCPRSYVNFFRLPRALPTWKRRVEVFLELSGMICT